MSTIIYLTYNLARIGNDDKTRTKSDNSALKNETCQITDKQNSVTNNLE